MSRAIGREEVVLFLHFDIACNVHVMYTDTNKY